MAINRSLGGQQKTKNKACICHIFLLSFRPSTSLSLIDFLRWMWFSVFIKDSVNFPPSTCPDSLSPCINYSAPKVLFSCFLCAKKNHLLVWLWTLLLQFYLLPATSCVRNDSKQQVPRHAVWVALIVVDIWDIPSSPNVPFPTWSDLNCSRIPHTEAAPCLWSPLLPLEPISALIILLGMRGPELHIAFEEAVNQGFLWWHHNVFCFIGLFWSLSRR